MTYCLAIRTETGIVFASDSRTNAGVDHISTYSKMNIFQLPGRLFVVLSTGNLATTQAVINRIQRDLEEPESTLSLANVKHILDAAKYIGNLSVRAQQEYADPLGKHSISAECSFILGGQIEGGSHDIQLIYPQGNSISASPSTPYLQIGEIKYGKPIMDRVLTEKTSLEDAARCALVSLDSTMRSNISVGPPVELSIYRKDSLKIDRQLRLENDSPEYVAIKDAWSSGLQQAFDQLPRFDWEG
jgi:putative proteasome-type protease